MFVIVIVYLGKYGEVRIVCGSLTGDYSCLCNSIILG